MADDIVTRLRTVDVWDDAVGLMGRAADEIERLRVALALAVGELSTHGQYAVYSPEQLMQQLLEDARRADDIVTLLNDELLHALREYRHYDAEVLAESIDEITYLREQNEILQDAAFEESRRAISLTTLYEIAVAEIRRLRVKRDDLLDFIDTLPDGEHALRAWEEANNG